MEKIIEIRGEIINNNILKLIDDSIKKYNGKYQILEVNVTESEVSKPYIKLSITVEENNIQSILETLANVAINISSDIEEPIIEASTKDATVPSSFYSTTNHHTDVYLNNVWVPVQNMRMDAVIVVKDQSVVATKLRDIKKGDLVICTSRGVRVNADKEIDSTQGFAFMINEVSSERRVELAVRELAKEMKEIKKRNGKIYFVAGPVVIHTGGMTSFQEIIQKGFVAGLLSGNALAVHDIEYDLYGTSLGIALDTGKVIKGGHSHHMRAINEVNKHGSIAEAVKNGTVKTGIMYELVKNNVPFVLAGSIRDDGPLPDTIMDLIEAQAAYADLIKDAEMVIMLSTMLHSIGTGNMLPSWIKTVCVDINPAVVNKLIDRGSAQAKGLVTDVGLFLTLLNQNL
ncbi:MAG: TIGR00300 family protein [Vulcanibacillus sp.]